MKARTVPLLFLFVALILGGIFFVSRKFFVSGEKTLTRAKIVTPKSSESAEVENENSIKLPRCKYALDELGVNETGFDEMDINLLELLVSNRGKPMGLSTLAAALSEDEGTIEDAIEPYLLANGYIERTARGRIASLKTYEMFRLSYLGSEKLDDDLTQGKLF